MASSLFEPPPRFMSFSSVLDGKFVLYGGKNVTPKSAYSYNPLTELWSPLETTGGPASKLYDGAATSHEGSSFMFGGSDGSSPHNCLYQLDQNNKFSEHKFHTEGSPMKKNGCRMITYNKSLLLFGGECDSYHIRPGSELIGLLTNELHSFNLEEGTWSSPVVSGTRPPPCYGFSFTKISDNIAVLFGGFNAKLKGLSNDVYILDLTNMHWSKLSNNNEEPCPMTRCDHAAVCLGYGGDHPKLLVIGGRGQEKFLNDVWMLDLQSRRWKEIKVSDLKARYGHCAGALVLSSRLTEVIIFGGRDFTNLAFTTVLRFECANGEWRLTETLRFTDLATNPERLREKEEQYMSHVEEAKLQEDKDGQLDLQTNGASALYAASETGEAEVVKLLLKKGVPVNSRDVNGSSALLVSSQNGHIEVTKLLLENGAQVDILDNDQWSPLMIACKSGQAAIAQLLLENEADAFLRNSKGQTALEIAKEFNQVNILSLFAKPKKKTAYPGILFSEGIKKVAVTTEEKTIDLVQDVGISLKFPENSLPSTDPPLEVAIQPCFSGSFVLPDYIELASPAYAITPNREVTFQKGLIVKIQHYANLQTEEDCEDMVFLSASSTPEYRGSIPIYKFKEMKEAKGMFRPGQKQPLGEIYLKHFSIVGVGKKIIKQIKSKVLKRLYSARLFITEKAAVFCICLHQPLYRQLCETVISSKYVPKDEQEPIEYNAVTLSSDEVSIKVVNSKDWKIALPKIPRLSRNEISQQVSYQEHEELKALGFPPRISIGVTPLTTNPQPLKLQVEGLNEDCTFDLFPEYFIPEVDMTPVSVDTAPILHAIQELHEELAQSENCNSNILDKATEMMDEMSLIESLLNNRNPGAVTAVSETLAKMKKETCQELHDITKQEVQKFKVAYDLERYVKQVNTFTSQMSVNYGANIKHISDNKAEFEAATQVFIANAANLMKSIKEVIKSSKSARALQNNKISSSLNSADKPSIRHLTLLKWKDKEGSDQKLELVYEICSVWRRMGILLEIKCGVLDAIKNRNLADDVKCCNEVLEIWLQQGGESYLVNWNGLCQLLEDLKFSVVAEKLQEAFGREILY